MILSYRYCAGFAYMTSSNDGLSGEKKAKIIIILKLLPKWAWRSEHGWIVAWVMVDMEVSHWGLIQENFLPKTQLAGSLHLLAPGAALFLGLLLLNGWSPLGCSCWPIPPGAGFPPWATLVGDILSDNAYSQNFLVVWHSSYPSFPLLSLVTGFRLESQTEVPSTTFCSLPVYLS